MCESRNAPVLTQRWWWGSGWRDNWQQRKEDNQPSAACLSSFKTDDKLKATRSLLIEYEDVVEVQIEQQSVGGHERAVRSVSRTFIWFFFLFRGKKKHLVPPCWWITNVTLWSSVTLWDPPNHNKKLWPQLWVTQPWKGPKNKLLLCLMSVLSICKNSF